MTDSILAAGGVKPYPETCRSIDWYAEGDERTIEAGGLRVIVRFIARKGRRARIEIVAPNGSVFHGLGLENADRITIENSSTQVLTRQANTAVSDDTGLAQT